MFIGIYSAFSTGKRSNDKILEKQFLKGLSIGTKGERINLFLRNYYRY